MGDPDTSPRKLEEMAINDQTSALITSFLKSERTKEFKDLTTPEERIKLIYKHEAYWPMLSVIRKRAGKADSKGEKDSVVSRQMRRYEKDGSLLHEFLSHSLLCNGCIKYSNKTHKCSRCRAVVYCSQDCLNADWESHKTVCQAGAGSSSGFMDRRRLQTDLKTAHQILAMSLIAP